MLPIKLTLWLYRHIGTLWVLAVTLISTAFIVAHATIGSLIGEVVSNILILDGSTCFTLGMAAVAEKCCDAINRFAIAVDPDNPFLKAEIHRLRAIGKN